MIVTAGDILAGMAMCGAAMIVLNRSDGWWLWLIAAVILAAL